MSLYYAENLRAVASRIANGSQDSTWPWETVIARALGAQPGEWFPPRQRRCGHRVMACLLAAEVLTDESSEEGV